MNRIPERILHTLSFAALLAVLLPSCKGPNEVQLQDDDPDKVAVETVNNLGSTEVPSVDSTGTLPSDRRRFHGVVEVLRLTYSGAFRDSTVAFSSVLLEDRTRPVLRLSGDTAGYWGVDLGPVFVNSTPMAKLPRSLGNDSPAGSVYVRDLTASYRPNTNITWSAPTSRFGPLEFSALSPEALTVLYPAGGTTIPRNRNLELRWSCRGGDLSIVLSYYDPTSRRAKPLFVLRPNIARGRAVIDAAILKLLPGNRLYVFTFAVVNKVEKTGVGNFPGLVLVQAADVYNSFVLLR